MKQTPLQKSGERTDDQVRQGEEAIPENGETGKSGRKRNTKRSGTSVSWEDTETSSESSSEDGEERGLRDGKKEGKGNTGQKQIAEDEEDDLDEEERKV